MKKKHKIDSLDDSQTLLLSVYENEFLLNVETKPKLRLNRTSKRPFHTEQYIQQYLSRNSRSIFVQIRCGTLLLKIKKGDIQVSLLKSLAT